VPGVGKLDNSNNNILPKAWESFLSSSTFIPVIVKTIERFHDTSWHMEPNKHECFEMVYIKRGKAVFEIAGYPAEIGPNDIIIIKPNQPHKFIVKSESGCEFIVLSFKFVNRFDGQYSDVSLENFLDFQNIGSEFLNYLLVMELFVLISRALKMEWENSIKNKSPKIKELIQASVNYINNNYERDISLKDIARYVFLSTSYFTRAFKEEMGISPINYLLKIRVEIKDTDNRISDIALSVGFSNQQRMYKSKKK